jgi:hypothetical protein
MTRRPAVYSGLLITAIVAPEVTRPPLVDGELLDHAGPVGGDLVLRLHRLDDADELARDLLARLDEDLAHVALQRGDELVGATAAPPTRALGPPRLRARGRRGAAVRGAVGGRLP